MGFSSVTGEETIMFADNCSFDGTSRGGAMTTNGQLWIGSTAARHVNLGTITSPLGTLNVGYSSPNITIDIVGGGTAMQQVNVDADTAPGTNPVLATAGGAITVTGGQVAAGTVGTNVIRTDSLAANTYTIQIQRTTTAASSTVADNGVAHFDSANFTVDGNGFVSLGGATGFFWTDVTASSASMIPNHGYTSDNAGLVTLTLPVTSPYGTIIRVVGVGAGGWKIAQNAGQNIQYGSVSTTVGVTGSLTSNTQYDGVDLLCTTANTTWTVLAVGTIGVN